MLVAKNIQKIVMNNIIVLQQKYKPIKQQYYV